MILSSSSQKVAVAAAIGTGVAVAALLFYSSKLRRREKKFHFSNETGISAYVRRHSTAMHPLQVELMQKTRQCVPQLYTMIGSLDELQLLQLMARSIKTKYVLDIGTFTSYSAFTLALALPSDGKVVSCDVETEYLRAVDAWKLWQQAGIEALFDFRLAPALNTLQLLLEEGKENFFDFAFIDADKENYVEYYELALKLVRSGGIIAVDNTLWQHEVLKETPCDNEGVVIKQLNGIIAQDDRVHVVMLDMADGVTICLKK